MDYISKGRSFQRFYIKLYRQQLRANTTKIFIIYIPTYNYAPYFGIKRRTPTDIYSLCGTYRMHNVKKYYIDMRNHNNSQLE